MVVPGRPPESVCATAKPGFGRRLCGRDLAEARRDARGAGRRSGRVISFPVVIADYEGERYLVAMLGENANWVRNVRAAGAGQCCAMASARSCTSKRSPPKAGQRSCAGTWRWHREPVPTSRSIRHAPLEQFERIAPQIPVFRITTATAEEPAG
jgi:hypothetical protein